MSDIKEAVFPSAPLTERIGLIAMYLFLFFAWESKGRASLMLGFVVLACLLDRRFWRALRYSAIAWATGILGLYILMRGGIAILSEPEYSQYHSDAIVRLLLLGLFPAIGWLLGGDQRRILVALTVALAGLLTGCLEHYNWSITSTLPWYQIRQQFGFNSANVFGVLAAMATLGLVVLAPRFWSGTKRAVKWLGILVWSLLLLLAAQGLAVSQSRSTLLALILTATGIVVFNWRTLLRTNMATIITALMIVAILVSSVGYLNRDGGMRRLLDEPDTYAKILTGRIDQVEAVYANGVGRSAGVRVHLARFGLEHWKENPLFGLGPGATKPLIKDKWTTWNKGFSDTHNTYVELLLRLGFAGATLMSLCLWLVFRSSWQAYKAGQIARDIFIVLVSAIVLQMFFGLFNFQLLDADFRFYWLLFGGALVSVHLRKAAAHVAGHLSESRKVGLLLLAPFAQRKEKTG